MNIIKLNAIESTNSYIKEIALKNTLNNFTIVWAEEQIKGRGQLGASWVSDNGKNLTFSILIQIIDFSLIHQFYLSMAVSIGLRNVLSKHTGSKIHIKWPNDILAEKDKVAGILIENIIGGVHIKQSVVGIGLNVNQEKFPEGIGNPTSLKIISGKEFDRNELLVEIVSTIQKYVELVENKEFKLLKMEYLSHLYKLNKPTMFEDVGGSVFLGKIINVSEEGRLIVELTDETTREFNLKEIKFASR